MTAADKQNLFKEVVTANAETFLQQAKNSSFDFSARSENIHHFINYTEDEIRSLAVKFFKLELAKRLNEMLQTHLNSKI